MAYKIHEKCKDATVAENNSRCPNDYMDFFF